MTSHHPTSRTDAEPDHDDFGGLQRDLSGLLTRRRALAWLGGAGITGLLVACNGGDGSTSAATSTSDGSDPATSTSTASSSATSTSATTAAATTDATTASSDVASAGAEIPDETAGPFPADGTNGPNLLTEEGVVRQDITNSVGSLTGTADGVPTTVRLHVVEAATGSPLPGAAVYLWHCTADGRYSIYEIDDQNYLRGVQVADESGVVTFTTVFPGCYQGRWPHCHFEVYVALDLATSGQAATKTSQLALPQSTCEQVYADGRYGNSLSNLGRLSLTTDNIFADGWESQLGTVTADGDGYAVDLLVRV